MAACCLLSAACYFAPPAWAGLGGQGIKRGDVLEKRTGMMPESVVAPYVAGPLDKLSRGMTNVFSSLLEWPLTIHDTRRDHGWLRAVTVGPIHGAGRVVLRFGSGVMDVATFPWPLPHRALWVRSQSLLMKETDRAAWVIDEARTTQQDMSYPPEGAAIQPRR